MPKDAAGWLDLGASFEQQQREAEALACYAQAVQASPGDAGALWALIRLAANLDDPVIEPAAQAMLALAPPDVLLLAKVGVRLASTRWTPIALACLERALVSPGDDAAAHATLAELLTAAARVHEAAEHYRLAIELSPTWPEIHNNLGILERQLDRLDQARACFQRAIDLRPGYVAALYNLGNAWAHPSTAAQACDWYRRVLDQEPAHAGASHGLALFTADRAERSLLFQRALAANPTLIEALVGKVEAQLDLCDWTTLAGDAAEIQRRLREQPGAPISPFAFLKVNGSAAEQQSCARNWVTHRLLPAAARAAGELHFEHCPGVRARLRLGYLSADFRDHVVGRLLVDLLPAHDRSRVEVVGFDCGRDDGSAVRARLIAGCDAFHVVGNLGLRALAEQIHAQRIDILVDLTGYTEGSRSEVLALRPAPVQVSWLGFPGTMGASFIDAVFCDPVLAPHSHQPWYDESIVHLAHGYQPGPAAGAAGVPGPMPAAQRVALGLPAESVVYASFNATFKLRPEMFACWMRVLAQVPDSVLWMSIEWPQAKARLQAFAAGQGIDPERLVFAPVVAPQAHLARLPAADLFLDCFPYSAGATAGQCVGQGVPLIALTGETYVSRMATAVLHAVGCGELAVSSIEDYERLAVRLGRSDAERIAWRARVRSSVGEARMFQPAAMATAVETACASLWHAFCNSARHDVLYDNPRAGKQRDLPPGRQALP